MADAAAAALGIAALIAGAPTHAGALHVLITGFESSEGGGSGLHFSQLRVGQDVSSLGSTV